MSLDDEFARYFSAMDRAGGADRCFLCRRTGSEVKAFFGFQEDGTPQSPEDHGIEDVILEDADILSYRGERPVCAVCQLNIDTIHALGEEDVMRRLMRTMETSRDELWPPREV